MKADFKIYGYLKEAPEGQLIEMASVGLAFKDKAALLKFAEFISYCVEELDEHGDWHEHYLDFRRFSERYPDIEVSRLDARNV